jgi:hypothetical protein
MFVHLPSYAGVNFTYRFGHEGGAARPSRNQSRAMAILAMPEHGQDARGTKSSRAGSNHNSS